MRTAPYPAFPDRHAGAVHGHQCVAEGTAVIRETIFENRFMHAVELISAWVPTSASTATRPSSKAWPSSTARR
jgi:UDP-N-acetylglucosamine enolpyruvyl transferase